MDSRTGGRVRPRGSTLRRGAALGLMGALVACASHSVRGAGEGPAEAPRLTVAQVARLLPPEEKEREGWARDVLAALEAQGLTPAAPTVCAVLAIIEQESGFEANPAVPGLPKLVRRKLEEDAGRLGPVGRRALQAMLQGKAPGESRTFEQRLEKLRTERDLDRLFRDMLAWYEREYPRLYATADLASELFKSQRLEEFNPVTTAGAMQVSVRFALEQAGEKRPEEEVREELYTRAGGVRYGTARLLGYEAGYARPLFRFADYNAGPYASRNAAFQEQVGKLTGLALTPDGDLLAYDKRGEPVDADSQSLRALLTFRERFAPDLSERQVRRDVRKEKTVEFEATETYRAVKRVWEKRMGESAAYARLPEVVIRSPKLSKERSTAWFARSVDARYQRCQARAKALEPPKPPRP